MIENMKSLHIRYITALSLIALLILFAYALIRVELVKQASDAPVINLAGRQRMLSQKLTKEVLLIAGNPSIEERKRYRDILKNSLITWTAVHEGLQYGNAALQLPGNNSPEVRNLFDQMEPYFQAIRRSAETILALSEEELSRLSVHSPVVQNIVEASPQYLELMDRIVFQYDKEARSRVDLLKHYETYIVLIVLVLLVLEAFLIFRPVVNKVRKAYDELRQANLQLQQEIAERKKAQLALEKAHENLEKIVEQRTRHLQQEINERKRAEEALRESEMRFRSITESANDAIISADSRGLIHFWNRAAERMFGYKQEEILGQSLVSIIPERYREAHSRGMKRFHETGESKVIGKTVELSALRKDGSEFPVELSLASWRTAKGVFVSGIIRDISERKQTEAELRKAKKAAEEASRAKSEFLANMSHEIRTPLNGIIGMIELALDTDLTPEQKEYLEMARISADSLFVLINDILDFSKIEAGKLELASVPFSLNKNITETVKTFAIKAQQKGLELIFYISPDVPDAVIGDPGRLRQILINLIGNAIKFTEKGEIILQVDKEWQKEKEVLLHFSVADSGIGIPKDKQEMIFESFTQIAEDTERKISGTGLGLAISSRLVRLMGGNIWVESPAECFPYNKESSSKRGERARKPPEADAMDREGRGPGTVFHFTATFQLQESPVTTGIDPPFEELQNVNILVVERNAVSREFIKKMLSDLGLTPVLAKCGREAMELLEQSGPPDQTFDLVLLDSQLPDSESFGLLDTLQKLQAVEKSSIIVMVPVSHKKGIPFRDERMISRFLVKPFSTQELLQAILECIGHAVQVDGEEAPERHDEPHRSRKSLRILVVEDNLVNQKLSARLLEKMGHRVTVAGNGKEALEHLAQQEFDLILMDVQMPEMNGFETTARIREAERETGRHVPIIALTAHAIKGYRDKCLKAGMDGYISKPIKPAEMRQVIEKYCKDSKTEEMPGTGK